MKFVIDYSTLDFRIDRAMTDSDTFPIMAESVWSKLSIMADFVWPNSVCTTPYGRLRMHNSVCPTQYAQLCMPNSVWQTPYGRLSMADFVWSKLRMTQLRMPNSVWQTQYGRLRMTQLRMPNSVWSKNIHLYNLNISYFFKFSFSKFFKVNIMTDINSTEYFSCFKTLSLLWNPLV